MGVGDEFSSDPADRGISESNPNGIVKKNMESIPERRKSQRDFVKIPHKNLFRIQF